jgi:hypothetical protein
MAIQETTMQNITLPMEKTGSAGSHVHTLRISDTGNS